MSSRAITCRLIGMGALLAAAMLAAPATALQLITASEAALPAVQTTGHDRSISRGPSVIVVSPTPGAGAIASPLNLTVRFESHGGSTIDLDSVLLTYLREPAIDLTQRVKPF